jgi:4-hydroxybenzoate polyprenyltransferase
MSARWSPWLPWLHLLRIPNLFTVPGDSLAGFFLAGAGVPGARVLPAAAASLCFYACGLVLNDLADREEDARERPDRPLPSGRITANQAGTAVGILAAGGMACCLALGRPGYIVGTLLLGLVFLYNLGGKRSALAGPVLLGLCRAGSVLLGACAAGTAWGDATLVPAGAAVVGLYIVAVSVAARNETRARVFTPPVIGHLIRGVIFVQAGIILAAGGGWVTAGLVAGMWLPSFILGRRVPAS